VDWLGVDERSPPRPDENLGCLDKFGPITYKYFIISPKFLFLYFYIIRAEFSVSPEPNCIPSPPLTTTHLQAINAIDERSSATIDK